MCSNMEFTVDATVAAVLKPAAEVTERALLRLAADAIKYAVIGLAVETIGCNALKVVNDEIQEAVMELSAGSLE